MSTDHAYPLTSEAAGQVDDDALYVSQQGEVACARHGGQYLADAVAAHPNRVSHVTPLDSWTHVPADLLDGLTCQGCA